jgi:hypothetical protein
VTTIPLEWPVASLAPLEGLNSALMIHTDDLPRDRRYPASGLEVIRDLLDEDGVGVVYTVPGRKQRNRNALACVDQTRRHSPQATVLIDADQYSGGSRKLASQGVDQSWTNLQLNAGLRWALTDSGFAGDRDEDGVKLILEGAARQHDVACRSGKGVIAALPLAGSWLADPRSLIGHIARVGVPVALMFEAEKDPLAAARAVDGLVDLLGSGVPTLVLRTDTSGLGALAHGAAAVAIGDYGRRRHIYPQVDRDPNDWVPVPKPAALVPDLLGYFWLDRIRDAYQLNPEHSVWRCGCRACGGRTIEWVLNDQQPDVAAFQHSVSALATLARRFFDPAKSAADWQLSWHGRVVDAQVLYGEVGGNNQIWSSKPELANWYSQYKRAGQSITGSPTQP